MTELASVSNRLRKLASARAISASWESVLIILTLSVEHLDRPGQWHTLPQSRELLLP